MVLISGTGLITLPAILETAPKLKMPLVSSNLCGAWLMLKTIQCAASESLRRAVPQLPPTA